MVVDPIGGGLTPNEQTQLYTEYEDVIQSLQQAFPDKTEVEVHLAIREYLGTLENKDASEIDSQKMVDAISQKFNIELSTEAANRIKSEWEDVTKDFNIDVSNLASVLTDYSSEGINKSDREYLMLLWQVLQKELEKAVGDESTSVGEANREMQEKEFNEFVEKKLEELNKAKSSNILNKVLKWVGVAAAIIGAIASCVAAVAACFTGVGVAAGVCLFASAGIMAGMAIAGTVAAIGEEFDIDLSLGSQIGKGIARLINACGGNLSEEQIEQVGMWVDFGIQMALTVVATALSLGAAGMPAILKGVTKLGTKGAEIAAKLAVPLVKVAGTSIDKIAKVISFSSQLINVFSALTGLAQAGTKAASTIVNYDLAMTRADLLEIQALLEKLATTRNMEQELLNALLSKIFAAMRENVQNSTNSSIQTMQQIASMKG